MKSIWIEYGWYGNAGNFDSHFPFSSTTCSISHYLSYCGFWFLVELWFFLAAKALFGFWWILRALLCFSEREIEFPPRVRSGRGFIKIQCQCRLIF